jgi:deoxyribodipyrimidine photolyase-like uncharacterized protein
MNDHDRSNFEFIMSLSPQQFDEWYTSISLDDIEYAIELCQTARLEMTLNTDAVKDLTEANDVLKNFML